MSKEDHLYTFFSASQLVNIYESLLMYSFLIVKKLSFRPSCFKRYIKLKYVNEQEKVMK
jgi:hypothetical protein